MWRLVVLTAVLLTGGVAAQLQWESTELSATVAPGENAIKVVYRFRNVGQAAISITRIQASCGCTTTDLPKKDFAPGEHGEFSASMTLPPQGGRSRKNITVFTNEPGQQPYMLGITGIKLEVLAVSQRNLFWFIGDQPTPKIVTLKAEAARPVKITAAVSDHQGMRADLREVRPGLEYTITLTPVTGGETLTQMTNAFITLESDLTEEENLLHRIAARVLAPLPMPQR